VGIDVSCFDQSLFLEVE